MSALREDMLSVLPNTTTQAYSLSASGDPNGTLLDLSWVGVPNRNPNKTGDFVAIWQNPGSLPFGSAALNTQNVTDTTPDGDLPFMHLSLTTLPYVLAYSVGPDSTTFHNIAAVIPVGVGGSVGALQPTTITLQWIGTRGVSCDYSTPIGTMPKTFGHSAVLVTGQTYDPVTSAPIATATPSDLQNDAISFGGVTMIAGQWYTAAYLAGSKPAQVAATVTFQVQQS